jgi:hypothetical protein
MGAPLEHPTTLYLIHDPQHAGSNIVQYILKTIMKPISIFGIFTSGRNGMVVSCCAMGNNRKEPVEIFLGKSLKGINSD